MKSGTLINGWQFWTKYINYVYLSNSKVHCGLRCQSRHAFKSCMLYFCAINQYRYLFWVHCKHHHIDSPICMTWPNTDVLSTVLQFHRLCLKLILTLLDGLSLPPLLYKPYGPDRAGRASSDPETGPSAGCREAVLQWCTSPVFGWGSWLKTWESKTKHRPSAKYSVDN